MVLSTRHRTALAYHSSAMHSGSSTIVASHEKVSAMDHVKRNQHSQGDIYDRPCGGARGGCGPCGDVGRGRGTHGHMHGRWWTAEWLCTQVLGQSASPVPTWSSSDAFPFQSFPDARGRRDSRERSQNICLVLTPLDALSHRRSWTSASPFPVSARSALTRHRAKGDHT
jgi:hypothetical protein